MMQRRGIFSGHALLGAVALLGAMHAPVAVAAEPAQSAVAVSGSVSVGRSEVQDFVATLPPEQRQRLSENPQALEQWVRGRLADKLLIAEATAQQWSQRPEIARQIEAATWEIVARSYLASVSQVPSDYPSDTELTAAYNRVKGNLTKPASYRISQVFISAPVGDQGGVAAARKTADEAAQKARRPKADFSKLITEYEKGAEAPAAETGWVTLDQLLPEVRPVVAKLKAGEVSEPVQSPAGFHVLKLVESREAQPATFEEAKEGLRARMKQERQGQIARAYLDGLANGAAVKVDGQAMKNVVDAATAASGSKR
ncbi:peptidylprolyl isomerase [Achromobacter pestifer]|uniref:Chaperone SurA n=1 Tax=Achromobacter pestifer TaxID=1353889 RepID=A0A6S6YWH0_9BURK|nr:peptidylprolyl isomerase [Achromobacter pestifer]CAB3647280.1 Chaperone SurA [Achromobacter pestifer]